MKPLQVLMRSREISLELGISLRTWERLIRADDAPAEFRILEDCLRFRRADVGSWLMSRQSSNYCASMSHVPPRNYPDITWNEPILPQMLTILQLAEVLAISRSSAYRLVNDRYIDSRRIETGISIGAGFFSWKVPGKLLIPTQRVQQYLAEIRL